ncbi:GAF domain-containing protein [Variovorax ginsengisoli]|uniref:Transcriptional regulator of acetoin/glycerol metabolism n=1 Tax=Variovorax ginsengisoli TaxID=363844 RepID=A0ABT9SB65_9BURK|nr:GAF domain-containing protein [Variovorax ginsengisoli]MDP9900617.1 transcriptional regulator of acetoin/glycerol metabolism [Variovorax ginsengisoli]
MSPVPHISASASGPSPALRAVRHAFADGAGLPAHRLDGLPACVERSWQRSLAAGLRPGDAPEYDTAEKATDAARSALWRCARDEVEQLWSAFGGDRWIVFCADREGLILYARRHLAERDSVLAPIEAGRRLREGHVGTTAPACALHEGTEIVVAGGQHYLDAFSDVFCLAVPVHGVDGSVAGVLDITGTGQRDAGLMHEHFRLAALRIEQQLFARLRHCHLLRLQLDPRLMDGPLAGVIAVEDDGTVRAISRPARRMLDLPLNVPLPDLHLQRLFAGALPAQRRRLMQPARQPLRIAKADGSHVWLQHVRAPMDKPLPDGEVSLKPPSGAKTQIQPPVSWREQSLDVVEQAWHLHEGNVAAMARQLGLSRTTVYARLRALRQRGALSVP